MRRTLLVMVWVVATVGVTYVANAAVELVDLQVFPRGARIEVLARAAPPPTTMAVPTRTANLTTTSAVPTTVPPVTTTTVAPVVTTAPPVAPVVTTAPPVTTTTVAVVVTTLPPTTTTTAVVPPAGATTTTSAPVPTTTAAPAPTTTLPPATTTTLPPVPPLVVSTGSLAEARIGENYRAELSASGGTPPYAWSLSVGSLPAGLGLSADGVLSGVPAAMADISLIFVVTDAAGREATSPVLAFAMAPDRRTVVARGGTVFIDIAGDSVSLFLVAPADGYSAVIVDPGGFRVEVQFVPLQGDATSFVVCEVNDGVACTTG